MTAGSVFLKCHMVPHARTVEKHPYSWQSCMVEVSSAKLYHICVGKDGEQHLNTTRADKYPIMR